MAWSWEPLHVDHNGIFQKDLAIYSFSPSTSAMFANTLYFAHQFTLVATDDFVGKRKEFMLDSCTIATASFTSFSYATVSSVMAFAFTNVVSYGLYVYLSHPSFLP